MATPILIYLEPSEIPLYGINEAALRGINIDKQKAAIKAACRRFDSYLRGKAIFPLTQVGEDVKECVAVLAVYSLIVIRGMSPEDDADKIILTRYEQQIQWLELIANGKAFPDVTDSSTTPSEGRSSARPRTASNPQQGFSTRGTCRRPGPFQS